MRRRGALVLVGAAAAVLAGCAEPAPGRDELRAALVRSGLSEEVASCTTDAVVDNLTEEQLADLALRGSGAAPVDDPERADDNADALRLAMDACRVLQAEAAPPTSSSTTSVPTSTPPVPTTRGEELRPAPADGAAGTAGG
jgi:hypothetical protein